MTFDCVKFSFGDIVYLRVNESEKEFGMITGFLFRPCGVRYMVSWGVNETEHFDIELCLHGETVELK